MESLSACLVKYIVSSNSSSSDIKPSSNDKRRASRTASILDFQKCKFYRQMRAAKQNSDWATATYHNVFVSKPLLKPDVAVAYEVAFPNSLMLCEFAQLEENVADIRTLEISLNSCALGEGYIL